MGTISEIWQKYIKPTWKEKKKSWVNTKQDNPKMCMPRNIIIKLLKNEDKEKILKPAEKIP